MSRNPQAPCNPSEEHLQSPQLTIVELKTKSTLINHRYTHVSWKK